MHTGLYSLATLVEVHSRMSNFLTTYLSKKLTIKNILITAFLILFFTQPAFAQRAAGAGGGVAGEEIFAQAACGILYEVLAKDFGGMLTVIAGSLAILASVTGSFKGAWALVFVSVGSFVYPHTVSVLFPGMCQ